MMTWFVLLLVTLDLSSIKTEPNLERRSELAITNANTALDTVRSAYDSGNADKVDTSLTEVDQSVELAYDSLAGSGKDPRKSKYFKRAELSLRMLLRRLEGIAQNFSVSDRAKIEAVRSHVSEIHDNLIQGIMSKRK